MTLASLRFLAVSLTLCLAPLMQPSTRAADEFVFYHENVMGTSLELRVVADDQQAADRAEHRVLAEVDRLTAIFSGHDPASEFRRWQDSTIGSSKVSPELFTILSKCDAWFDQSDGAFEPRVSALTRLWSSCAKQDRTPTDAELRSVICLIRARAWRLDASTRTVERTSSCPLTLDAIAKGEIVERACAVGLDRKQGVHGLLLNVGGDLRVCGDFQRILGIAPPRGDSETTEPLAWIVVRDRSVATSGNAQRGFPVQGRWYSHIFDPRTGRPVEEIVSATVIAPRGADADALATIFNVLRVEDSLVLAGSLPDVACLLVTKDGRVVRSAEWGKYERPRIVPVALRTEDDGPSTPVWSDRYELAIDFEINRPEVQGGRYRRPYVVIWVEDKNGVAVRTLLVWISLGGAGPDQWLPDLTRWYRGDVAHSSADRKGMAYTIGRPTRPPGKYSVIWDGKDDRGKPLGSGTYTILVEAAREHGTHQVIRKPILLEDEPFVEHVAGNVEIQSATITYRRKAAEP